jgi:hypothetical protein
MVFWSSLFVASSSRSSSTTRGTSVGEKLPPPAKVATGGDPQAGRAYRLACASQSEDLLSRSVRQANKIKQRLGGNGGMDSPFPPRPKGMWRRTYERLREQAVDAEERANNALLPYVARFLAVSNKSKDKRSFWK